ncbi:N-acetylmuramoyl-L-alanine amidase [Chryseobacterium sp. CBTAP 102]|uniref:N-acetylmuramoyl-L-alanine amidase n=1 Tax=Chryseobacterium sp. CBTAP 102 TaxID=2135644 RepID=UPI000D919291|nr:N-acetylmuramoyl-L-alanine amidase [Chryseobacterium sp. CBTAP 102]PXW18200.1 N-acetylmuramoyl-L-alanine amidase [Chryseobacterium sp. CBTAP 102]
MRTINYIVIHCTATQPDVTIESIKTYWKENLKWKNPGYHYMIKSDGEIVNTLPIDQVSNGVAGWNSQIINISYIGGIDKSNHTKDTRTKDQKKSIVKLLRELKSKFPKAKIQGHRDFPNVHKACPSFDAKKEYAGLS